MDSEILHQLAIERQQYISALRRRKARLIALRTSAWLGYFAVVGGAVMWLVLVLSR